MHYLLTTQQAAQYLNISTRTLERYRQQASGPLFIRFGRRVAYDKKDLKQWLDENKTLI